MCKKLICLTSFVLVVVLAGFAQAEAQAELLVNPDFEAGLESWAAWGGGSGAGPGGWFWSSDYHATVMEDGTAQGGEKYVEAGLTDREGWWWNGMWVYQNHPATPGQTYEFSGWVRNADAGVITGGVKLSFEWRDAAPTAVDGGDDDRGAKLPDGVINHAFDLTEEWTYINATEVAPEGALGLTAAFLASAGVNFDLDEASLVEVLPPPAYVIGDFEGDLGTLTAWGDAPEGVSFAIGNTAATLGESNLELTHPGGGREAATIYSASIPLLSISPRLRRCRWI